MRKFFGLDVRSLALMRILLGLILMWDIGLRLSTCRAFFWGGPLTVKKASLEALALPFLPSVHLLSESLAVQTGIHLLHLLFALFLVLGWHTRLASLACWYFTLSLHLSNEMVLNGGDYLLRAYLFAGVFLPWGEAYSLDSKNEASVVADTASVFLFAQVCLLYWSAAMLKMGDAWTKGNSALYIALNLSNFLTPLGEHLLKQSSLLPSLTAFVLWVEWLAPLCLILGSAKLRLLGISLLVALHVGIGLSLAVGIFWLVPIAALLAMIPSEAWGEAKTKSFLPRPIQASLCLLMPLLVFLNLSSNSFLQLKVPHFLYVPSRILGFHYGWNMFTQLSQQKDEWLETKASLEDGTEWDLLWDRRYSPDPPSNLAFAHRNQRWRRYHLNLQNPRYQEYRLAYLDFLQENWSKQNGQSVRQAELALYSRVIYPNFRDSEPQRKKLQRWPQN